MRRPGAARALLALLASLLPLCAVPPEPVPGGLADRTRGVALARPRPGDPGPALGAAGPGRVSPPALLPGREPGGRPLAGEALAVPSEASPVHRAGPAREPVRGPPSA